MQVNRSAKRSHRRRKGSKIVNPLDTSFLAEAQRDRPRVAPDPSHMCAGDGEGKLCCACCGEAQSLTGTSPRRTVRLPAVNKGHSSWSSDGGGGGGRTERRKGMTVRGQGRGAGIRRPAMLMHQKPGKNSEPGDTGEPCRWVQWHPARTETAGKLAASLDRADSTADAI